MLNTVLREIRFEAERIVWTAGPQCFDVDYTHLRLDISGAEDVGTLTTTIDFARASAINRALLTLGENEDTFHRSCLVAGALLYEIQAVAANTR